MVRPKPKSYKTNAPNGAKKKEEDQNMGVFSCFSHFFGTLAKTPDNTAKYYRFGCLEIFNTEYKRFIQFSYVKQNFYI